MATLRITRQSEFANRFRKIHIEVDGKKIGVISNGESKDFEIMEGAHTLRAQVDWCFSNLVSFNIAEQETRAFRLTSFAKHNPLGIFAAIYYITFGSKKYLHLKEEEADPVNR